MSAQRAHCRRTWDLDWDLELGRVEGSGVCCFEDPKSTVVVHPSTRWDVSSDETMARSSVFSESSRFSGDGSKPAQSFRK
jgi:hypothetical protein